MFWIGLIVGMVCGVPLGLGVMSLCRGAATAPDDTEIYDWEREAGLHEQHVRSIRIGTLTADEREHLIAAAAENRLFFVPPGE